MTLQTNTQAIDSAPPQRSRFESRDPRSSVVAPQPYYRLVRRQGVGYAVADFPRDCLIRLIDYPELPLRINTHEVVKAGRSTLLVRAELPLRAGMTSVAYKRARPKNWLKTIQRMVRSSRAFRSWHLGRELREQGINTPRPLAVILPRRFRLVRDVFLVTEWVNGASNLTESLCRLQRLPVRLQSDRLTQAAESLGRLLGRMHARHISHRDLKPSNLLLSDCNNHVQSHVIDLDGAVRRSFLSTKTRRRNLARLLVGLQPFPVIRHTVRLRFLKAYLAEQHETSRGWKTVWRELAESSASLSARKGRR